MSWKTILVHVDETAEASDRIAYATALARRYQATLIGVAAALPRPPLTAGMGFVVVEVDSGDTERAEKSLADAQRKFAAVVSAAGVKSEWRSDVDFPSWTIARAGAAADLLIIGREKRGADEDGYWRADAGDILISAGRPVLIVPAGIAEPRFDKVLVAWKNTRETRRALADALPALAAAKDVALLHIAEGGESVSGADDAAALLSRHGINVRIESLRHKRDAVEDRILSFAADARPDLIVAGAYGHARLRERLLGGVTRALVERSPVPCLLSH